MRKQFDEDLSDLSEDLIKMAALSENAIRLSMQALAGQNEEIAKQVIKEDSGIDALEKIIEQKALKIIIKYQPVARDLRNVMTALKMITDIERIADQASDICSITLKMVGQRYCKKIEHLPLMAETASQMVHDSVKCYVNHDTGLAENVIKKDDIVDDMFVEIKDELIGYLNNQPEFAEQIIYFMMIAKYIERIGDHAVNIAEWEIFNSTGIHKNSRIL